MRGLAKKIITFTMLNMRKLTVGEIVACSELSMEEVKQLVGLEAYCDA